MSNELIRDLMMVTMALPFVLMIGIVIGIVVYSTRKNRRTQTRVAREIAAHWRATIIEIQTGREHQWWQKQPRYAVPRLLLKVMYQRTDSSMGRLTVARNEKTNQDEPDWSVRHNCPDIAYHGAPLPDAPPTYTEVEEQWTVGAPIEKVSGAFYPRLARA